LQPNSEHTRNPLRPQSSKQHTRMGERLKPHETYHAPSERSHESEGTYYTKKSIALLCPFDARVFRMLLFQCLGLILCLFILGCMSEIFDTERENPLLIPDAYLYPSYSPDGGEIVFIKQHITKYNPTSQTPIINPDSSGLWIMGNDGSNMRMILNGTNICSPVFSPVEDLIAMGYNNNIAIYSVKDSSISFVTESGESYFPFWNSTGMKLVFDSNLSSLQQPNALHTFNLEDNVISPITIHGNLIFCKMPVWYPHYNFIYYQTWNGSNQRCIDKFNIEQSEIETIITSRSNKYKDLSYPRVSPDGTELIFVDDLQIWKTSIDGSGWMQLTTDRGDCPSWSPDGQRIVFTAPDAESSVGFGVIWTMSYDGLNKRQITFTAGVTIE